MRFVLICCVAVSAALGAWAHPDAPTEATYLGNEGIMVSDGETKILFDPLFPNGFGIYQLVPETIRTDLVSGVTPYDDIDAIFISHMHPDHFSVGEVIAYLDAHPDVQLFAPEQAVSWMREETENESIFERVTSVPLNRLDAPLTYQAGELSIDVVRIPHAGWPGRADVSNLVWRVTLADGATVMHLGDADPDNTHYAPHAAHWQKTRTDAAYPPYWFFTMGDGPELIKERLNIETATGVHVPIELPTDLFVSGADFFHTPGESRVIGKEAGE